MAFTFDGSLADIRAYFPSFNLLSVYFAEDSQVGDSSTKTSIVNTFNCFQNFKRLYRDFRLFWRRLVLEGII